MIPFLEKVALGHEEGFNLLILSTSKKEDAIYWETILEASKGLLIPKETAVITVVEQWEGGAGNALGTLHAFEEAEKVALKKGLPSPLSFLKQGGSVALYHTAGKGSRMAPLTLAEGGMKSAVKLPAFLPGELGPLSVLEMVIRQTAPLAELSKGRLSVFWTDQLFLPTTLSWAPPTAAVEIYAIASPPLLKDDFKEKKLSSYGLWKEDCYFDKMSEEQFESFGEEPLMNGAVNLGSFSIEADLLSALLKEYQPELTSRTGKLDTDPDWWLVASQEKELYLEFKGKERAGRYDRFKSLMGDRGVKPRILGSDSDWWDFGTVESYRKQLGKLLIRDPEGARLRALFGINDTSFQGDSLILSSQVEACSVKASLLVGVKAKNCHFDQTVAIDSKLEGGVLSQALIYRSNSG